MNANNAGALALTLARERDRALLFRDLATLRADIPLFTSIDALEWTGPTDAFPPLAARLDSAVPIWGLEARDSGLGIGGSSSISARAEA